MGKENSNTREPTFSEVKAIGESVSGSLVASSLSSVHFKLLNLANNRKVPKSLTRDDTLNKGIVSFEGATPARYEPRRRAST